jgi:Ser/Thr protein kinase RdoA (MazF antagonist)
VRSIVTPASVAEVVTQHYALNAPLECTLLKPSLNDTYLITSRDGVPCVARVYGASRRSSDIAFELGLLRHLREGGVSVGEPLNTSNGGMTCRLLAPEGVRELALFGYVRGEPMWQPDERQHMLWGRLAAQIHGRADSFVSEQARVAFDLEHLVHAPLRSLQPYLAHRPEDWSFLLQLAGALDSWASRAPKGDLDRGPCHGDLGPKNVLVEGDALTALDFDRCGSGWRAYDFAPAYRATREAGKESLWEAFVRGYTSLRPIGHGDLAAVPVVRAMRQLEMFGVFASNASRWGAFTVSDRTLDRWLEGLQKLAQENGLSRTRGRPTSIPAAPAVVEGRLGVDIAAKPVSVVYSLISEDALAGVIARSYPTEAPLTCQLLQRGLNDTYLVHGGRGSYLARLHRTRERRSDEIGYEVSLLRHLSERDVAVAIPVLARDGSASVALDAAEGTRRLVLLPQIAGEPASWKLPEHGHAVGRALASIHAGSNDFSSDTPRAPLDVDRLITRPLAAIRPFLARRDADWLSLCRVTDELRACVAALADDGLEWGVCHGSFRPEQVNLDEHGRAAVAGFDQCAPGWRVFDFALLQWASKGDERQREYWSSFLRGYADVRPLRPVEVRALPVFHAVQRLASLGSRAENARVEWGTRQLRLNVLESELAFFNQWGYENGGRLNDR